MHVNSPEGLPGQHVREHRDTVITAGWEINCDLRRSLCSATSPGHCKERANSHFRGEREKSQCCEQPRCCLVVTASSGRHCWLTRVRLNLSQRTRVSHQVGERKSAFSCACSSAGIGRGKICHCQWARVHYTLHLHSSTFSSSLFHSRLVGL